MLYSLYLHLKLDLRNKNVLLTYYLMPIVFFLFFGSILLSMNDEYVKIYGQAMVIFAITIGAILGSPIPLIEFYETDIKKAYKVGNVPLWLPVMLNFISACIHLFVTSIIIIILAPIIFNVQPISDYLIFFTSLFAFLVLSVSIGSVLGLYVKNTSRLTVIGQLIFLPSIMLSGILFPNEMLPEIFVKLSYVFPTTIGFQSMISNKLEFGLLGIELGVTLIFIILIAYRIKTIKTD